MAQSKLPLELCSILGPAVGIAIRTGARAAPGRARRSARLSTLSVAAEDTAAKPESRTERAVASTSQLKQPPNLFESTTDDYTHVPLSTLDHPSTPRTPATALRSLIDGRQYQQADALLLDIHAAHEHVRPHPQFAVHARRLFNRDPASSAWLGWWAISPSVVDVARFARGQPDRLAHDLASAKRRAGEALGEVVLATKMDHERIAEFALVLCRKGFVKLVAEGVLAKLAAFAPVEQSERVWEACLAGYQAQLNELGEMAQWTPSSKHYRRELAADFAAAYQLDAATALKKARGAMIRAHTSLGRLDLAAKLATASGLELLPGTRPGRSARVPAFTYVRLLSLAALEDRFDVFARLYEGFVADSRRLTRTQRLELRERMPYLARAAYPGEGTPQVKEAFTVFRYASFASEIEEGSGVGEQVAAARMSAVHALEKALEEKDVRKAGSVVVRAIKSKLVLPLEPTARFISLARDNELEPLLDSLDELFHAQREGIRSWMTGYWATATMLSYNREQDWDAALAVFFNLFTLQGLPTVVKEAAEVLAVDERRWDVPPGAHSAPRQLVPDAHTFAIAVQALVPRLAQAQGAAPRDGRRGSEPSPHLGLVDALLASLLHEPLEFPVRTRSLQMTAAGKTRPTLDAFVFLPFLQLHARQRRPAPSLLALAAELQARGVAVPKHHWAVVLGAFAGEGREYDLFLLLDRLEGRANGEVETRASPEVRDMVGRMTWPRAGAGAEEGLGVVVYTSVLAGLQKCGEVGVAARVRERMLDAGLEAKVDGHFGRVMRRLAGQGLGAARAST